MEEEELNKRLSARITEVFDNYEDTTADEGWALLRQKYPEEKKDRGLIWWWYAAAAILLLGFGLWFMQGPADVKKQVAVIVKPASKPQPAPANNGADTSASAGKIAAAVKPLPAPAGQWAAGQLPNTITSKQPAIAIAKNRTGAATFGQAGKQPNAPINQTNVNPQLPATSSATNGSTPVVADNYAATKPGNTVSPPVSNAITAGGTDSAATATQSIAQNTGKPTVAKSALTSAEALAKLYAETANDPKNTKPNIKKDKKPVIGVYAATYFNYANGSDNRVNVGAGVSSDFSITRKLKLSTGVAIAQNSLNYDYAKNNNSNTQSYDVARSGLSPSGNSGFNSGLNNISGSALGYDASLSYGASPTAQNYSASLIGLDVPVNLKYEFNPGKNETYVSAGLSSGTFINQTYTTEYAISARQTQQTTTQNSFGNFYFAKMLNVSFGMGYPLGKSNRLVVEPFLKYPLSGLGAQQIKFGAGGVNLKLNFTTRKK